MKIWFDILTPTHLLFFEPMIKKFKKRHRILCTSRKYSEVSNLAPIRRLPMKIVGRHGGADRAGKLEAGASRMKSLIGHISKFSPDLTVSFGSPEAARISYGLGINHIAFNDTPYSMAIKRLSNPLIQKLLIPWIIPKKSFMGYGIGREDIVQFRSIIAAPISQRTVSGRIKLPYRPGRKTILIRPAEDQAAYAVRKSAVKPIIRSILKKHPTENVVVLARYASQRKDLREAFGGKARIIGMSYDGKALLEGCDVFVGSGGTMTAESALLGIPTISYDAVPNAAERYLIRSKLAVRERDPERVANMVGRMLASKSPSTERAKREMAMMEDPYCKLVEVMKSM